MRGPGSVQFHILDQRAALVPASKLRGGLGVAPDVLFGQKRRGVLAQAFRRHVAAQCRRAAHHRIVVAMAAIDSGRPDLHLGGSSQGEFKESTDYATSG